MNLLSKTLYLKYIQCPKLLWLSVNTPFVIPPPSDTDKARMAEGRNVEEWARRLFADGILINHSDGLEATLEESKSVLNAPSIGDDIFRAVVQSGRMVAEMDILHINRVNLLDLFEVKGSTEIKDEYIPDVAFQRYVAGQAGLPMGECAVITLRNDYVRQGKVDVSKMFRIQDVTSDVDELLASMDQNITEALRIMDLPECPEVNIGQHCKDCPLADTLDGCHSHIHAEPCNVFSLYRIPSKRAWGWNGQGILKSTDIPSDYPLTERQRIQVKAERSGEPHINKRQIRAFCNHLEYPLHFLDFETFAPAVPMFDGSSPYQQIPFQYSLHIQSAPDQELSQIAHHSWIWDGEGDPRQELLKRLEGLLGNKGSIVVYNAQFERMILKQAVKVSPKDTDWLTVILGRFVDLLEPFRAFHWYHPAQHGSASIKSVLPSLTGKGYECLEISNGTMASTEYMRVMFGDGKEERAKVFSQLEEYCGLDTWGMVEIVGKLRGLIK